MRVRVVGARRLDDEEVNLVAFGDGVNVVSVARRDVAGAVCASEGGLARWGSRPAPARTPSCAGPPQVKSSQVKSLDLT